MNQRTIAVGIIRNAQHDIFIAQRPEGSHMGGFWEFPGGKVEAGESPEQALRRELAEEVGISVQHAELITTSVHHFDDRTMAFHFFLVDRWTGTPCGNEGQLVRWCAQQALQADEFPPANAAIIRQLTASH